MSPTAQLYRVKQPIPDVEQEIYLLVEQTIPDVEQEIYLLFDEVYGRCNAPLLAVHPEFLAYLYSFLEEASKPLFDRELLRDWYSSTTPPIFANLQVENILSQPEKPTITIDTDFLFNGYLLFNIIESWMRELVQSTDKQNGQQIRINLLQKLFHALRKLNHYEIIPSERLERLGGLIQNVQVQHEQPQVGGIHLHRQLLEVGAYDLLEDPRRKALLATFLTTPQSMGDIAKEKTEGIGSIQGISRNLHTSLQRVFHLLPTQVQKDYGSAEQALQIVAKDQVKAEARSRKISEGWKVDKLRQTGKANKGKQKDFTRSWKTNLSQAASKRWERSRAERAAKQEQSQQPPTRRASV